MSNKIEYSRLVTKRSTVPGTVPTIPATLTLDDSWLNTDLLEGEMFINLADDLLWMRTTSGIVPISVGASGAPALSAVLAVGNTTGGTDLVLTSGDSFKSSVTGPQLDFGTILSNPYCTITTDNGVDADSSITVRGGSNPYIGLSTNGYNQAFEMYGNGNGATLYDLGAGPIRLNSSGTGGKLELYAQGTSGVVEIDAPTVKMRTRTPAAGTGVFGEIQSQNNTSVAISSHNNTDNRGVFIAARNSTINSAIVNTAVVAGKAITAAVSHTLYAGFLKLHTDAGVKIADIDGTSYTFGFRTGTAGTGSFAACGATGGFEAEASGTYSIAMGYNTTALGNGDVAIGQGCTASGSTSFATGTNSTASGLRSFAGSNSTASGSYSVAFGNGGQASNTGSFAVGGTASGVSAISLGGVASGSYSFAGPGGGSVTASGGYSTAGGRVVTADHYGEWSYGTGSSTTNGTAQSGFVSFARRTTNATASELFLDGSFNSTGSLRFTIPTGSAYRVIVTAIALNTTTMASKEWSGSGIIKNVAGTTSLVAAITMTSVVADAAMAAATLATTASDHNDALTITATGIAVTNINWSVKVEYIKITQ